MKDKIKEILASLEKEKKIKILFAVENGSRAWRMESQDSDFDVRFVFVRPLEDYIQIHSPSEVINAGFDRSGNACDIKGAYLDLLGIDIFKFVKMLSSSNPTTIEWLITDIVYFGKQNSVFKEYAVKNFNKISLYHHYKSMCKNNYLKYLKSGASLTYKKYLYTFRGLVNAKWVAHKKSLPPIIFTGALKAIRGIIPESIIKKLEEIIRLKISGKEQEIIQNIVRLDQYVEDFLKDDTEAPKEKPHSTLNSLNNELRRIILSQK